MSTMMPAEDLLELQEIYMTDADGMMSLYKPGAACPKVLNEKRLVSTICILQLVEGEHVIGMSYCRDPARLDMDFEVQNAREQALGNVRMLLVRDVVDCIRRKP